MAKLGMGTPEPAQSVDSGKLAADFLSRNMKVARESLDDFASGIIGIVAPPSYGKTVLAATFSEDCPPLPPKVRPKRGEEVILKDAAWVMADDTGLSSLADMGVWPLLVREIWDRPDTEFEYRKILKEIAAEVKEGVEAGVIKYAVVDTASSLLLHMLEYLNKTYATVADDQQFQKWIDLETWISGFMFSLRRLGIPVIVLFHMKYRQEWVSKKTTAEQKQKLKNKKKAELLPGQYDIELELQGNRAGRWFYKNCGYIFPMKRDSMRDAPLIVTDDSESTVVKCRSMWLNQHEPPNLRALWNKLHNKEGESK